MFEYVYSVPAALCKDRGSVLSERGKSALDPNSDVLSN